MIFYRPMATKETEDMESLCFIQNQYSIARQVL